MPIRVAVVGPGRVGQALARRWREAGANVLGFVGRDAGRTAAALRFVGGGRALAFADLGAAHVVVFAVGDPDLEAAVAVAAASGARRCSLWLHTSGRFGLEVLAPLTGPGIRLGALHPVAPFGDAEAGYRQLPGRPAVLLGEAAAHRLLQRLAAMLGMAPLWARATGDRALYHTACALAANGLTALRSAVDAVLQSADALTKDDAALLAHSLMGAALQSCRERSPLQALSGPVVRGDAATVAAHRAALRRLGAHGVDAIYTALMQQALLLSVQRGLPAPAAAALQQVLRPAFD